MKKKIRMMKTIVHLVLMKHPEIADLDELEKLIHRYYEEADLVYLPAFIDISKSTKEGPWT